MIYHSKTIRLIPSTIVFFHLSGLVTATTVSELSKTAQPALLYLVPFTILPLITRAYIKVRRNNNNNDNDKDKKTSIYTG